MGAYSKTKLITKNTFLELVVDEKIPMADARRRSYTDGAIICDDHKVLEAKEQEFQTNASSMGQESAQVLPGSTQLEAVAEQSENTVMQMAPTCGASQAQPSIKADGSQPMLMPMASMGNMTAWYLPMVFMQPEQFPDTQVQQSQQSRSQGFPRCPAMPQFQRAGSRSHSLNEASTPSPEEFTTLMLRNLPNTYTRDMLVDLLNSEGFAGMFNFVYLPIDFKTHAGLGYAFVDCSSRHETDRMRHHFEGFTGWAVRSEKICSVSWSHPEQQGFAAHVERYRNSPVMHECVPEDWKPALYSGGLRVPFPPPTRKLRNPHIRDLPK
jgi:hypothetical protein